ncbi:SRPBCC domain-containing protein [Nesterenkonia ebinurensis]|uniref:SRPBCC domain-containing protein n=1 Tax=Nesterenkonia ebinurensis TaxID=2608252 RepID=UPI00123C8FF1|nr:SRPBCC domain-containing protein [Nesterenkonia ebinurensis]
MTEDRVFRVRIDAPPEAAWAALTDPAQTSEWYFGSQLRTTWQVGSPIEYYSGGKLQITGMLITYDPPRSFTHEFIAVWNGHREDQGSLTWTVEPDGEGCTVMLRHSGAHGQETADGSQHIIGALKRYLESSQRVAAVPIRKRA